MLSTPDVEGLIEKIQGERSDTRPQVSIRYYNGRINGLDRAIEIIRSHFGAGTMESLSKDFGYYYKDVDPADLRSDSPTDTEDREVRG